MTWLVRAVVAATLCVDGATVVTLRCDASYPPVPAPSVRSPSAYGVAVERARDGLFHIDGAAGRGRVAFVVDTGATVTVLSAAQARRLGGAPLHVSGGTALQTANGPATMRWWHLPDLAIAGRRIGPVDVAVVDVAVVDGAAPALLGQDVLARLGVITIADGRLTIERPAGD